jgi:transcriptional regulator with GAF, ATPase, and Fis domain
MRLPTEYEPELGSLKELLLEMAQELSVSILLEIIVRRLAKQPHVALARIWLIRPRDLCATCLRREECPDMTSCLHLVASASRPSTNGSTDWSLLDDDFQRIPLGRRKIGRIAVTGEPLEINDGVSGPQGFRRPDWAKAEGIIGFAGQPLIYKGDVLGVLALFTRIPFVSEWLDWLRIIADHAAVAIANARAFEEIKSLKEQLEIETDHLKEEVREAKSFDRMIGKSALMRKVLEQIDLVAGTDSTVLILGESGTGKELAAREIHLRSSRSARPLIKVNCAAVPRDLYESEFFGHAKGAFTGAVKDRVGKFQAADGGTLFLDEVAEIPLELQSKLLRILQEGEYQRVGEDRSRWVDVRIIAATNRDLKSELKARRFRTDLYYRLSVFPIEMPPLHLRKEDIPLLAEFFLDVAARKLQRPRPKLTQANIVELQNYDWPGNVRELQNVLERASIIARSNTLHFDLSLGPMRYNSVQHNGSFTKAATDTEIMVDAEIKRLERINIVKALHKSGGKIYGPGGAAELLEVKPTTLASRIKKMEIGTKFK